MADNFGEYALGCVNGIVRLVTRQAEATGGPPENLLSPFFYRTRHVALQDKTYTFPAPHVNGYAHVTTSWPMGCK